MGVRDPRVDDYIDGLADWQQEIRRTVREIVHAADPEIDETIKRTNRRGQTVNAVALTVMIRQIADNNRAGGWRALKSQR